MSFHMTGKGVFGMFIKHIATRNHQILNLYCRDTRIMQCKGYFSTNLFAK